MGVIGAILGDIAGMPFEFQQEIEDWQKSEKYNIFGERCYGQHYTDDSVLTIAVGMAIASGDLDFTKWLKQYGNDYFKVGYGRSFKNWLEKEKASPYNSYGNGSAMRASACGQYARTLKEAQYLARLSAMPTHNHPEGIKGAQVLASCVWMAENNTVYSKDDILNYAIQKYPLKEYIYSPERMIKDYENSVSFDVSCMTSVPIAIRCFYEYDDFQEMMRKINSMYIDTDTIGAIAGSIFESYYGQCTKEDKKLLKKFLDEKLYLSVECIEKSDKTLVYNFIDLLSPNSQMLTSNTVKFNLEIIENELSYRTPKGLLHNRCKTCQTKLNLLQRKIFYYCPKCGQCIK